MLNWDFPYRSQRMPVMADNLVSTSQPLASQAGIQMLLKGGNAVDAALATAITLTIVEPTSNGIGSDAFAIIWDGQKLHGLNGSGRSPRGWSPERFAQKNEMPKRGWDAVTVPGAVSVWVELSKRFGKLPFEQLFEPAIRYASNGFPVTPITACRWAEAVEIFKEFPDFQKTFLPGGRAPNPGERFRCQDQADTLEEIARTRGESFYQGNLAEQIAAASHAQGGVMTLEDLAEHRADWVAPISQSYRGYRLHEVPPNGQGLAALIALGILEHFQLTDHPVDSVDSVHLQLEAMKLALADIRQHLSDSDTLAVPVEDLLHPDYLANRAKTIDMSRAQFPETGIPIDRGTVYLTTADASGMMVSFIQSNFMGFGSGVVVPGTGISLQNRGFGFTLEKGHPNRVAGGKRPYHTIIPGFVTKNGQPVMSFGVMGGHMQAQGHVQMMTRIFDYHQNPQTASDAPRWHLTQDDNRVAVDREFSEATLGALSARGHQTERNVSDGLFGGAQLILKHGGHYVSGSDHRKDGCAIGF
jgi:gamma-glutamyltranspeptidase / glutathione hydrolase